jgi:hypothetical protein
LCNCPQEEAVEVTGKTDPQAAAETVLRRPNTATEWCIVKMGGEGAVLVTKAGEVHHAPAFKVSSSGRLLCIHIVNRLTTACTLKAQPAAPRPAW